jgi:hypothetical protein
MASISAIRYFRSGYLETATTSEKIDRSARSLTDSEEFLGHGTPWGVVRRPEWTSWVGAGTAHREIVNSPEISETFSGACDRRGFLAGRNGAFQTGCPDDGPISGARLPP